MAIRIATGELTTHLAPFDPQYKGYVILHSCQCKEEKDILESSKNLLEMDLDYIPENSIIGYAKLASIKKYDPKSFDIDSPFHGYNNLELFKAQEKWEKVFGWIFSECVYLPLPVMGIQGDNCGDWWKATDPFSLVCIERAFNIGKLK